MIVLKILLMTIGTMSLLSLSLYIYLAVKGDNLTLYSSHRVITWNSRLLSVEQKTFLILAAIGLLICMYNGAEAMLFWMPNDWGSVDSEGEYQTLKASLAATFAIFGGGPLIQFISNATHEEFLLKEIREKAEGLERIVNAFINASVLEGLKEEYQKKIETLEAKTQKRGPIAKSFERHLLPEAQRIQNYKYLISIIESQKSKSSNA